MENNLNYWATLCGKDPEKYSVDCKPDELNITRNKPHTQAPAHHLPGQQPYTDQQFPTQYPAAPAFYYPPSTIQPICYSQPMEVPGLPARLQPVPTAAAVVYPDISNWLNYCNSHPDHAGEDFRSHIAAFNRHGYRHMNQLTGPQMTIEKLSEWLSIGGGMADLLIQYAEEDVMLIKNGSFSMKLAN
ncbi:hypothetical protein L208DRAFT_1379050 [Tricholoma matsutake]|nr:hypothetical protein L208DRAFT_1379050 [Tricholoma matsutake 945]